MAVQGEAQLVSSITRAIHEHYPSAWWLKVHGGGYQRSGIPDLLVCLDGHLLGLEVKHQKPGESAEAARARATPLQLLEIAKLRESGATSQVVLSVAEVLDLLAGLSGGNLC